MLQVSSTMHELQVTPLLTSKTSRHKRQKLQRMSQSFDDYMESERHQRLENITPRSSYRRRSNPNILDIIPPPPPLYAPPSLPSEPPPPPYSRSHRTSAFNRRSVSHIIDSDTSEYFTQVNKITNIQMMRISVFLPLIEKCIFIYQEIRIKDHLYRMVKVEGCCTMARLSSLGANCSLVDTKV